MYGLQLAERLNDLEGIQWSSLGILKQAWPKEKAAIVQKARRSAGRGGTTEEPTIDRRKPTRFQAELDKAKIRDCVVKVTWTGDADVDVMVEEPSGAICAFRNPRTSGGRRAAG